MAWGDAHKSGKGKESYIKGQLDTQVCSTIKSDAAKNALIPGVSDYLDKQDEKLCKKTKFVSKLKIDAEKVDLGPVKLTKLKIRAEQTLEDTSASLSLIAVGDLDVLGAQFAFNGGFNIMKNIPIRVWGNATVKLELKEASTLIEGTVGFGVSTLRPQDSYVYVGGEPICVRPSRYEEVARKWVELDPPESLCKNSLAEPIKTGDVFNDLSSDDPTKQRAAAADLTNAIVDDLRSLAPTPTAPPEGLKAAKAILAGYEIGSLYGLVDAQGIQVRAKYDSIVTAGYLDGRMYWNGSEDYLKGKTVLTPVGEAPARNGDFSLEATLDLLPAAKSYMPASGRVLLGRAAYNNQPTTGFLAVDGHASLAGSNAKIQGGVDTLGNFVFNGSIDLKILDQPLAEANVTITRTTPGAFKTQNNTCQALYNAGLIKKAPDSNGGFMVCVVGKMQIPQLADASVAGVFGEIGEGKNREIGMVLKGTGTIKPGGYELASAAVEVNTFPSTAGFTATGQLKVGSVIDAKATVAISLVTKRFYLSAEARLTLPTIGGVNGYIKLTNCKLNETRTGNARPEYNPDCNKAGVGRLLAEASVKFASIEFGIAADIASNGQFNLEAWTRGDLALGGMIFGNKSVLGLAAGASLEWEVVLKLSNSNASADLRGYAGVWATLYTVFGDETVRLGVGLCGYASKDQLKLGVQFDVLGYKVKLGNC